METADLEEENDGRNEAAICVARGSQGYGPVRLIPAPGILDTSYAPGSFPAVCANNPNRWEHDQFHKAAKYQSDMQKTQRPDAAMQAPKEEREVFEEAAKEILSGSKPWRPTWQALGLSYDRPVVGGAKGAPSPRS
jgi:large subunit ribosomal protein L23